MKRNHRATKVNQKAKTGGAFPTEFPHVEVLHEYDDKLMDELLKDPQLKPAAVLLRKFSPDQFEQFKEWICIMGHYERFVRERQVKGTWVNELQKLTKKLCKPFSKNPA